MMPTKLISSYISRVALISILCLLPFMASGQQRPKIMTAKTDTIPFFRGVSVSGDLVGLTQLLISDYGQYEAALRMNIKDKYFPIIEIGIGKADAEDDATKLSYQTRAPYSRIGLDFNMMKNKHDIYRIYAGFRYAFTTFKYDVTSPGIEDPVWHDHVDFKADGVKSTYHWAELAVGIDAKIWGPFRMGWSVRYRRRISHSESDFGDAWYVPGFGKADGSNLGGTFNVTFEL